MSQNWENLLRSIGIVAAIAILGYAANATNLTSAIGPNYAYLIAGIAAIALNALDKYYSPTGTVLAGTVGVRQ